MTGPEALLTGLTIVAGGGVWLGYVFLVNDAKWKIARDSAPRGDAAAIEPEIVALKDEIRRLRSELMEHRDRSSEYDMSLEARLHQLEMRFGQSSSGPPEELSSRLGSTDRPL